MNLKYFLIEADKRVIDAPVIINWIDKIDARKLKWGSYHNIKKRTILYIKNNKNTIYTDVLSMPFFLISKKLQEIMKLYEPNMGYRQIILIDFKYETVNQYFLPHLEEINCISDESQFNIDHSILKKIVLDEEKIKDKCIFSLAGVKNRHVIVRLDFLESMLRRGAIFNFTEVEIKNIGERSLGHGI